MKQEESAASSCTSESEDTIGSLCGPVDGFDQSDAAAAFDPVAGANPLTLDGCKKIFEHGLVATKIADRSRRGTLVFVGRCGFHDGSWSISKVHRDDAIVFENDGAFCA